MAERVRATVARELDEAAGTRVQQAVIAALQARHALAPKDVRYLHPGRVPLILVDDAGVRDETLLVAGALLETYHPALAVPAPAARAFGAPVEDLLARVPRPSEAEDDDALREALVAADDDARLVALVERLDHARHLHLYPETEWRPLYEGVAAVYLPVAEWRGGRVGARYRRWAGAFERRLHSR